MTATTKSPPPPPRLLALDPGGRRTGVAVSDELGLFAHPRPAVHAASEAEMAAAVAAIVAAESPAEVVIGVPLGLRGNETDQTVAARRLAAALRSHLRVPVTEWDERLSTREASRQVKGRARRERGDLDSAAAALILQAVLDSRRQAVPR